MPVRLRLTALMFVLTALLPTTALAHEGNPNYRSEIEGVEPAAPGVTVEVLNFDDSLRLENRGGETVMVQGYEEEPYVRIKPDGTVEVNTRSPAYFLNRDRYAESSVPESADPEAPPVWEEVDRTGQFSWHDHRIHYMSRSLPPQVEDTSERTMIFDYAVPIQVGGRPAEITGALYWVGEEDGFPLAPFIGLAGFALIAGGAIVFLRRRRGQDRIAADADAPSPAGRDAW
jgi:LPXTG-motif cell wall-anchored protein